MKTLDQKNNDRIDALLQARQDGMYNYAKSTKELIDMGIKIGFQHNGAITVPRSFDKHLDKYNRSNLEFEWLATFKDETLPLHQFGPGPEEEHHYGDIDQNKLKSVALISNFDWPTDNNEKRVIVTLDWNTGLFSFMNGFIPQDELGQLLEPVPGPKKLILVRKRRETPVVGDLSEELQQFHGPIDEVFYYNRFLLGFETPNGIKRTILVQPTGNINVWECHNIAKK